MILVDRSVWIEHFRHNDSRLAGLLGQGQVLMHPFVVGELALDNLTSRDGIIRELKNLPQITVATDDEVLDFIGARALFGLGIGYVDAHLLASVQLTPAAALWTLDRRLALAVQRLGR